MQLQVISVKTTDLGTFILSVLSEPPEDEAMSVCLSRLLGGAKVPKAGAEILIITARL